MYGVARFARFGEIPSIDVHVGRCEWYSLTIGSHTGSRACPPIYSMVNQKAPDSSPQGGQFTMVYTDMLMNMLWMLMV